MTVKGFFRKIESGTKNFFKKGGTLDTTMRKVGNTITKGSGVLGSIGKIAREAAPLAGAVFGPEATAGLLAADKGLQEAKKLGRVGAAAAAGVRSGVKARSVGTAADALKMQLENAKNIRAGIKPVAVAAGIEAPKPAAEDGIGLNGMAGINFA